MNEAGSEVEDIESDTEAVGEETSSNLAKPFLSCSRMLLLEEDLSSIAGDGDKGGIRILT
jgi:hypothetical protein